MLQRWMIICLLSWISIGQAEITVVATDDDLTFLPVEAAFQYSTLWEAENLTIEWEIAPGYYLYQNKFTFIGEKQTELETAIFPAGERINDPYFGELIVYPEDFSIILPFAQANSSAAQIVMQFQGCAASGFCYPPQTIRLSSSGLQTALPALPESSEGDIEDYANFYMLLSFYGFGLLLAFTPCVLPMLPILSGILCGNQNLTTQRGFMLSLSYVLSMAISYSLLGIMAASLGQTLQSWVQHPLVLTGFSLLLVLMAATLFEWLPWKLPTFSGLEGAQRRLPKGSLIGAAGMGALATLVTSPCVTAPLIGALTYIAQTGDHIFGGLALFILALGMGTPLLLVGTAGSALLPRAGQWMRTISSVLGLLLLALAVWLLRAFLSGSQLLSLSALVSLIGAIRLGAFQRSNSLAAKVGILLLAYAVLLGWGAWQGKQHPLFFLTAAKPDSVQVYEPTTLHSLSALQTHLEQTNQPTMLMVSASWCTTCHHIEHSILATPQVQALAASFSQLRLDVTHKTPETDAFMQAYGLFAPPALLFFDATGQEIPNTRIVADTTLLQVTGVLRKITVESD